MNTLDLSKIPLLSSYTNNANGLESIFNDVISTILGILGFLALLGVVYSGYIMITSGGDTSKFAQGRKNLIWSVTGVVIITTVWFLMQFAINLSAAIFG